MVEFCAQLNQDLLTYNSLQDIDGVFCQAGQEDGTHVQSEVKEEELNIFEVDGFVDDATLHFQGKNPEKKADSYDKQEKKLQPPVSTEDPVEKRSLGDPWLR